MDKPVTSQAPSPQSKTAGAGMRPSVTVPVLVLSLAILFLLVVAGSVLEIGERLGRVHPWLAAAFYGIVLLVIGLGVVLPVVRVASQPVFSLYRLRDERGRAKRWWCRRLVQGLERTANLSSNDSAYLRSCLEGGNEADDKLIAFFLTHVVPTMDAQTKQAARTVFCATAISQSPLVDAATVLSVSFTLVRQLVDACGFRPSTLALGRLYIRVMAAALVAGGLEDMDLETLLAGVLGGGASGKISGVVVASTAQGLVNAFLVFRVGSMVKGYLCAEDGPARMADLRRASYREALEAMKTSGFVQEMLGIVKDRMGSAAHAVVSTVKEAANDAGTAAREGVKGAVATMGRAVRSNPVTRTLGTVVGKKAVRPERESSTPDFSPPK